MNTMIVHLSQQQDFKLYNNKQRRLSGYKSNPHDCAKCERIKQCTESKNKQKLVTRHIWEHYIEMAEDIRHSPIGKETYSMRSQTIERVFADAKEKHAMRYTPYRGLNQVTNWVRLKFAAMNLKKIANWKFKNSESLDSLHFLSVLFRFLNHSDRKPCLA